MRILLLLAILTVFADIAYATTWTKGELTDPLTGNKVASCEIVSYGGYIYFWPSKFDLVFWPMTDNNFICFNPVNGYAAFNSDFEKVPESDKAQLKKWLNENYDPSKAPKSYWERLQWIEKVYSQRTMDDEFWCRFYRLLAYQSRFSDPGVSSGYAQRALKIILSLRTSNKDEKLAVEYDYLVGEYSRILGKPADVMSNFEKVKKVAFRDKDGYVAYLIRLARERETMISGLPLLEAELTKGLHDQDLAVVLRLLITMHASLGNREEEKKYIAIFESGTFLIPVLSEAPQTGKELLQLLEDRKVRHKFRKVLDKKMGEIEKAVHGDVLPKE